MEFYLSFDELLGKTASPIMLIFLPIFLITTLVEGLIIWRRQKAYPWKNAGISISMAIGHFVSQAASRGLIFGVIAAAVYEIRLMTIPVSFTHWLSLIVLFLLVDFGFGSYWVPGWWEEVWVACLQGLYDSRRGRRELATLRKDPPIWRYRIWSISRH